MLAPLIQMKIIVFSTAVGWDAFIDVIHICILQTVECCYNDVIYICIHFLHWRCLLCCDFEPGISGL